MKYIILIFALSLAISKISPAQNIEKLNTSKQIDSLKSSYTGNIILVNFWASWCKPCVEEFPDLLKIRNDFSDEGLKVIFISLDFPEEVNTKLIPFLKQNKVDFTTYLCDSKNPEQIMDYFDKNWDGAIPATFIFNKKGELGSKVIGSHNYDFYKNEVSKYIHSPSMNNGFE